MSQIEEKDYTSKFDLRLWKKLILHSRESWGDLIKLMAWMVVCALCDVVFPLMTAYAIDHFITAGTTDGLVPFGVAYVLIIALQVTGCYGFQICSSRVESNVGYTIRKKGFRKLQELPFSYYDRTPVGYLMSRLSSDTQRLAETIGWVFLELVWAIVMFTCALITMFTLNWKMTLVIMLVVPPLALISFYFQQKILQSHRAVRKTNSRITGAFNEGIMGAKTTKTLVREDMNTEEFTQLTRDMKRSAVRAATLSSLYMPIVMALGSLATAYALWRGGNLVLVGGLTVGVLQAFVNYTVQVFEPIRSIAMVFSEMQSAQAAGERVMSLLETEPDIVDSAEVEKIFGDNFKPIKENWPALHGDITFEHVDFQYKDGEKVLSDFNLQVKQGETIALVGPTGAGKSTVVNLICRFYEPTGGVIKIDGVDYKERSQLWLQSNLGYVLQEPRLFSGTIKDNIRYGRLEATDEEIMQAARMVNAEEFILKMEKGYDTDVGEGGSRLSTGEKQLISFARALLADPRIFVLDEATSSVDTQTEQIIQHAITKVLEGRTSFIIAHRLSTIRTADRILVIEGGRIAEMGDHQTLMEKKGSYWRLYTNQFMEEQSMELLQG